MLGKIYIIISTLSILGVVVFWKKRKELSAAIILGIIGLLISLYLCTDYSMFFWESFPLMNFLQYPWRFLVFASFFMSLLAGSIIVFVQQILPDRKFTYILSGILVFVIIILQAKFFVPQKTLFVDSDYYTNENTLHWNISKISDEYMPKDFPKPTSEKQTVSFAFPFVPQPGESIVEHDTTQEKKAVITANKNMSLSLNVAYFPAWQYTIDSIAKPIQDISGKIYIGILEGKHSYRVSYKQTVVEIIGNLLSLTGYIIVILGIINLLKKDIHEKI